MNPAFEPLRIPLGDPKDRSEDPKPEIPHREPFLPVSFHNPASSVFRVMTRGLSRGVPLGCLLLALAGCATKSTVETRKVERAASYAELGAEDRALVDQGQIRVGMTPDAVFIAWGKPAQVLESEDASGRTTTWLYQGNKTDEYLFWNYREYPRKDGTVYMERFLDRTYDFKSYVSAELVFQGGKLRSWRTLPRPADSTKFSAW